MLIRTGSRTERFTMFGSVGSGLNGTVFKTRSGGQEVLRYATVVIDSNPGHEVKQDVLIFRDRVFWPCSKTK